MGCVPGLRHLHSFHKPFQQALGHISTALNVLAGQMKGKEGLKANHLEMGTFETTPAHDPHHVTQSSQGLLGVEGSEIDPPRSPR